MLGRYTIKQHGSLRKEFTIPLGRWGVHRKENDWQRKTAINVTKERSGLGVQEG